MLNSHIAVFCFQLQVSSSAEDVRYFRGGSDVDVYKEYLTASRWYMWAAELLPWRIREVRFLLPFDQIAYLGGKQRGSDMNDKLYKFCFIGTVSYVQLIMCRCGNEQAVHSRTYYSP